MDDRKKIWDETFKEKSPEELGWYEEIPEPSLSLIKKYLTEKEELILDAGCGRGNLLSHLLKEGFRNLQGIDLSSEAIATISLDLKKENQEIPVSFMTADLTEKLNFPQKGKLWHDRAVFHFLLDEREREVYIANLKNFLKKDGIFILACFSKRNSAQMCNGFPVRKYDETELTELFKKDFELLENIHYNYTMPWGDTRDFIYLVFRKF
ncbi:MAG: class I SAM-dependent methyltransferase [Fusobacteriaceae bacterium]